MTLRQKNTTPVRVRLLNAATDRIENLGLSGIKAREITAKAGCSLGALYNHFSDIDELILYVNVNTLESLGETLDAAVTQTVTQESALVELARAYMTFALENTRLWSALFDHRLPEGEAFPDWYLDAHTVLFRNIATPLSNLRPDLDQSSLQTRSYTLFSAVHGVVHMALRGRIAGVDINQLENEVVSLIENLMMGARARQELE